MPDITPLKAARLYMADVGSDQYLKDAELTEYLDLNDGNARRAAADALDAIAVSETLVGKVIRTQDLQTDGTKVADSLRKQADRLRALADQDDDGGWYGFDVVYPPRRGRHHAEGVEGTPVWGL